MRKNKNRGKKLNLSVVYEISGLNLDNLVNILRNKGITLTDVKKTDRKTLRLAVNYSDTEKFFAITDNLCYNVKRIGEKGRYGVLFRLWRNFGLVIGALIFIICGAMADDVVFSIDYYGSGSVVSREINQYLVSCGVKPFAKFSGIDLAALSDGILSYSDKISFAECVKDGNRLKINLALAGSPVKTLDAGKERVVSDVDGEIEYIKVYRGTALKNAGDKVAAGETVCDGYAIIKDTTVKVGVIATVTVKAERVYVYRSKEPDEEDYAEIFALASFGEGEILSCSTEKNVSETGEYEYKVKIVYRRLLY